MRHCIHSGREAFLLSLFTNYYCFDIGQVIPDLTSLHNGIVRRLSESRKWYESSIMVQSSLAAG
jgi:hypothetical protein